MTLRYCGTGGNDANTGLSWAQRKLTLNGVEDSPVVAGDICYIGPGVYRELLTCDVSGGAGTPIVYVGDVTGENTDGVGGIVRITGSDNDQTAARANCITGTTRSYRTFRGFSFDTTTSNPIYGGNDTRTNWIIEDCSFQHGIAGTGCITLSGANQAAWTIRRCVLIVGYNTYGINLTNAATVDNTGHLVELCDFIGYGTSVFNARIGGISVRNCTSIGGAMGYRIFSALSVGQTMTVNNTIICFGNAAFSATVLGEIIEDYNDIWAVFTPRTNVAVGANSNTYPPLFNRGVFHSGAGQVSGYRMPQPPFGSLSTWSQVRAIADTGAATEDLFGMPRPATAGKRSWGAVQFQNQIRDTGTVRGGVASLRFTDAGRKQFFLPVTGLAQITVSVYVNREANYAGTNPQMIIKQPGQADRTTTDAGAAGGWNLLTDTFTPSAIPGWVAVELVSNNTAAAGNYDTFFDDLAVTVSPAVGAMETWLWDTQVADWVSAAGGGVTRGRILYGVP